MQPRFNGTGRMPKPLREFLAAQAMEIREPHEVLPLWLESVDTFVEATNFLAEFDGIERCRSRICNLKSFGGVVDCNVAPLAHHIQRVQ